MPCIYIIIVQKLEDGIMFLMEQISCKMCSNIQMC